MNIKSDNKLSNRMPKGVGVQSKDLPCILTIIQSVRYQQPMDQPYDLKIQPFIRKVISEEQPYSRDLKIGEEWQAIDTGWITKVGLFVIFNKEGRNLSIQPTPEEKTAIKNRIIEIGVLVNENNSIRDMHCDNKMIKPIIILKILAGETQQLTPVQMDQLVFRCKNGEAKCTITVLPE
jgi:hypothetical protein